MTIIAYAFLSLLLVIGVLVFLIMVGGSRKKSAWEQSREDDEQLEAIAEYQALRALERDLFHVNS